MFSLTYNNNSFRYNYKFIALKIILFLILFNIIIYISGPICFAESIEESLLENIENQLNKLNLNSVERFISSLKLDGEGLFKGSFLDNVKAVINGSGQFDYKNFFTYIVNLIFDDIVKFVPMLAGIVAICVICSFLGNLPSDKQSEKVGKVIYFACFSLVAVMVFSVFKGLMSSTSGVIGSLQTQMQLILPIILTLITSIGSVVTVSTFQPVVALLTSSVVSLIGSIVLPIFVFSFVFNIVGNLSSSVKLEKCAKFLSSLFKWLLGTIFTVFMAILSLQGIMASVSDSISIKTTKFALKSYVPLVGNYLSEGLGLILASGVLIKNAVGVTGLFVLIATIALPLVEIVIFMLGLKLVAAVVEPLSNNNMSNFLYGCSKCLNMLIACIASIAFMYLITIGLLMCSSNIF